MPFYPFLGEASTTKIDYRKKSTLTLSSQLEDLGSFTLLFLRQVETHLAQQLSFGELAGSSAKSNTTRLYFFPGPLAALESLNGGMH